MTYLYIYEIFISDTIWVLVLVYGSLEWSCVFLTFPWKVGYFALSGDRQRGSMQNSSKNRSIWSRPREKDLATWEKQQNNSLLFPLIRQKHKWWKDSVHKISIANIIDILLCMRAPPDFLCQIFSRRNFETWNTWDKPQVFNRANVWTFPQKINVFLLLVSYFIFGVLSNEHVEGEGSIWPRGSSGMDAPIWPSPA